MRPLFKCLLLSLSAVASAPVFAAYTIPLHETPEKALAFDASLDGRRGTFIFDSGWGVSAVTPAMAKAMGCIPWGRLTGFRAIGERIDMAQCKPAHIETAGLVLALPTLGIFDIMSYMPPGSDQYAGGIGLDAFAGRVITLQSNARRILVEDDVSLRIRIKAAKAIPIRFVRAVEGASFTVDVGVSTSSGMLWMEIDTGNTGRTLIARHVANLVGLNPVLEHQSVSMPLVDGVVVQGEVRVADLILDGDIGLDFLKLWDVTLDLEHERGWIAPAK